MPGTFSPPPRVGDPDMHHGTCVTHVPWCMPGSITSSFLWSRWRGKRYTGSPSACATRNFTYLVRGPLCPFRFPPELRQDYVVSWWSVWCGDIKPLNRIINPRHQIEHYCIPFGRRYTYSSNKPHDVNQNNLAIYFNFLFVDRFSYSSHFIGFNCTLLRMDWFHPYLPRLLHWHRKKSDRSNIHMNHKDWWYSRDDKKTQPTAQSMTCAIGRIHNDLKVIMGAITKRISSPTSEYDAISPAGEVGSHAATCN